MSDDISIPRESGNICADLGIPDPDESLDKAKLAHRIAAIVKERGWTQTRAAHAMGIDQTKLSASVRRAVACAAMRRRRLTA